MAKPAQYICFSHRPLRLGAQCRRGFVGLTHHVCVIERGEFSALAQDAAIGGLLGIHLREEMKIGNSIVSVDGLELKDFDYIDIGTMLQTSGAVPVVIKSLIFPTTAALGQDWKAARIGETAPTSYVTESSAAIICSRREASHPHSPN